MAGFLVEEVEIVKLKPHPQNYRKHPPDQIEHIKASIKDHGFYRNVVVAKDYTILAGHGAVIASRELARPTVPCVKLDLDANDPRALMVLTGDNEISHLGEVDDRQLTEILKQVMAATPDKTLLGTGFTPEMLANLVLVTRPQSEIEDFNAAAQWVGMPQYEPVKQGLKVVVSFLNEEARQDFAKRLGYNFTDSTKSVWWPPKDDDDVASLRFEQKEVAAEKPVEQPK